MAQKTKGLMGLGLAVLLLIAVGACSPEPTAPEEIAAVPSDATAEEVVASFFRWYAGYPGNPLADDALATNPVVSPGLVEKVDAVLASLENSPAAYDPILCAQDRPQSFRVDVIDRSPDSVSAVVHSNFEGHQIYVGVMRTDGQWMIADVSCPEDASSDLAEDSETVAPKEATSVPTVVPTAELAADEEDEKNLEIGLTAGWPTLRDEEYGFQLSYPPDWGYMDLPVYDPGAGGPPTVIKRFVILYPQTWEERLKPGSPPDPNVVSYPAISIEVCMGPMEAYRREFMELGSSEAIQINGITASYERDTYEDHNIARYVFRHPTEDELIINLTDAINGFSMRVAESGDAASLIPLVVGTFSFTN